MQKALSPADVEVWVRLLLSNATVVHNAPSLCVNARMTIRMTVRMAVGRDTITVGNVSDSIGTGVEFHRELFFNEDAVRILIEPVFINCTIQLKVEIPQELGHDQPGLGISKVLAQALHSGQLSFSAMHRLL